MAALPDVPPAKDSGFLVRLGAALLVVVTLTAATGFVMSNRSGTAAKPTNGVVPVPGGDTPVVPGAKAEPKMSGIPLFAGWPKEKPDLVIVVTGQTYGYLRPCGCSQHQLGGLERRANFMQGMREQGWRVVGLDLGDIMPTKATDGQYEQKKKKYVTTMESLAAMGYVAVGVGQTEIESQLHHLLGLTKLQDSAKPPIVLAGNMVGVQRAQGQPVVVTPREKHFKAGDKDERPMVEAVEIAADPQLPLGVAGVIGAGIAVELRKIDPEFDYVDPAAALKDAVKDMAKAKANPELKALLYQGYVADAEKVAKDFPQFQLIVCLSASDEAEPSMQPKLVNDGKTMIVRVGHKGRYVGAVGVFKTEKGFDLKYQLAEMSEAFDTPQTKEAEEAQKVLPMLEKYALEVKKANFLESYKKKQHSLQVANPKAGIKYVGSDACIKCHAAEGKKWSETKHAHAYEALEKVAKRPSLRNFDPECIQCHVVGFEFETGFKNAKDTPLLMNNGCENCHGPGSGHAAKPKDKTLIQEMFPWRLGGEEKLPPKEFLEKMAKMNPIDRGNVDMPARQQRLIGNLEQACRKCHDNENDPKFDFYTYMLQIYHSGLKAGGLPPGAK